MFFVTLPGTTPIPPGADLGWEGVATAGNVRSLLGKGQLQAVKRMPSTVSSEFQNRYSTDHPKPPPSDPCCSTACGVSGAALLNHPPKCLTMVFPRIPHIMTTLKSVHC
jgi:hypothetical protein